MQETFSALVILLSFGLIILGIRLKVHLSVSIFLGALLLYFSHALPPYSIGHSIFRALSQWESIRLIALIFLVIFMSRLMKAAGTLQRISDSLKKAFSDARVSYGTIPAIIGLLPMPAGAYISAQMVNKAADDLGVSAEDRTFTNYWFRHVWEFSWPFYQGVIFTSAIVGISVRNLVLYMFPITIFAIIVGYIYGIRPVRAHAEEKGDISGLKDFFVVLWPVWMVIIISIGLGIDLLWGLIITDVTMILAYRLERDRFMGALKESMNYSIFLILISILIFKQSLQDTGSATALYSFMKTYGIPEMLVVVLFPMIVGMISGLTVAFVGISFPIMLYILAPGGMPSISMIALAYLSGFIGVLFSPLHLCLIYSAEYFKANLAKVFRKLIYPLATLFAIGSAYSLFLGLI